MLRSYTVGLISLRGAAEKERSTTPGTVGEEGVGHPSDRDLAGGRRGKSYVSLVCTRYLGDVWGGHIGMYSRRWASLGLQHCTLYVWKSSRVGTFCVGTVKADKLRLPVLARRYSLLVRALVRDGRHHVDGRYQMHKEEGLLYEYRGRTTPVHCIVHPSGTASEYRTLVRVERGVCSLRY
jgi:hypothetical protein